MFTDGSSSGIADVTKGEEKLVLSFLAKSAQQVELYALTRPCSLAPKLLIHMLTVIM